MRVSPPVRSLIVPSRITTRPSPGGTEALLPSSGSLGILVLQTSAEPAGGSTQNLGVSAGLGRDLLLKVTSSTWKPRTGLPPGPGTGPMRRTLTNCPCSVLVGPPSELLASSLGARVIEVPVQVTGTEMYLRPLVS